ncbi:MAG: DMT family transporter [Moraxellaceae bacterium]|nr:DMT family transporter [Moraxellaceae bacterium]MDZ4386524.1 DMT family transporter [Moraxellaceae bacterium]
MSVSQAAKADIYLLIVTVLAAVSWIFSKEAVLLMPPLLFMALRFLLAGLILASIGQRQLFQLSARQWLRSTRVGMVFAAGMCLWIMGLHFGHHIGEGGFLTSLGIVLVPVMGRLVFREVVPASTWVALPIALVGLAMISLEGGFQTEPGQLFFIAAAVVFALFYTMNTRAANHREVVNADGELTLVDRVPALPLTAIVMLCVGLVASVLTLTLEPWQQSVMNFSGAMAGWILASAVIGSAARFLLQTHAQSLSRHSHGVVIMVVEPVWIVLFAFAWFGERMSMTQGFGCALIFAALLVSRRAMLMRWLAGLRQPSR